jgi:8-oxo-dGTP diphosphatase
VPLNGTPGPGAPTTAATLCLLVRGQPPREVLLGYKKTGFGRDLYNGFGGKVEPGETPLAAAVREMREESGMHVRAEDMRCVAHLTFTFVAQPHWDQIVYVYLAARWSGIPVESREMRPAWFAVDRIPYAHMWADDRHWLPRVLAGERLRAAFIFADDNETILSHEIGPWGGVLDDG